MKCLKQYVFRPGMSQFICDTPEETRGEGVLVGSALSPELPERGSYDLAIVLCRPVVFPKTV